MTSNLNKGKFVGLCGDFDGDPSDDVTNATLINQLYIVPSTVNLTGL